MENIAPCVQKRSKMNKEFLSVIEKTNTYKRLIDRFLELKDLNSPLPLLVDGVSDGALYSLMYSLIRDISKKDKTPPLIIVGEEKKGARLNEFLKRMLGHLNIELFKIYL